MHTPLHSVHQALGARMAPFAGWDMPIQYRGILQEHEQTRRAASLFDTCHMGEFDLRGPSAASDLERLLTQRVSTLAPGQSRYGFLLREDGGILDDLMVFRRSADHFFLVVNAGTLSSDASWIRTHLSPDTRFEDLSPGRAKLDVQGPTARREMEAAFSMRLPDLKYFRFTDLDLGGVPCTVSRTGYTGEWGYEIFFDAKEAERMWARLTERGTIAPAGLGARDTLRLESGYPLYGHELGVDQTPVPAARGAFLDTTKDFIGREAVLRDLNGGVPRYLAGLRMDSKRAARAGAAVLLEGRTAGMVTSGSYAPSLEMAIAFAYLDAPLCASGTRLTVHQQGAELGATVTEVPFYRDGTARKPADWTGPQ